jgi:tight adherence protein C
MAGLAAATVAGAVLLFILGITGRGANPARARLEAFTRGRDDFGMPGDIGPTLRERVGRPMFEGAMRALAGILPKGFVAGVESKLTLAGSPMTLANFLMFQVASVLVFGMLGFLLVVTGGGLSLTTLFMFAVAIVMGVMLPRLWLNQRVSARQTAILKSLPDAFDLITVCVEAGLGLDAALARVAERVEGPFGEELSRTLREIALGKMRRDALKEMGERTGVQDLQTFVNAVIQAEQMGSGIGQVLRVQSDQLRIRRRQRAEEQAYKAPVKMIFPLVLCIFPTLFIVILGPAVITIMRDFKT